MFEAPFTFTIDGNEYSRTASNPLYQITLDEVTDADPGKTPWILVMNYIHKGGTNPATQVRTTATGFPNLPSDGTLNFNTLQVDDGTYPDGSSVSNQASWGHTGNDLFNKLCIALGVPDTSGISLWNANGLEVRFVAKTNRHTRLMNFKTTGEVIAYFRYGYYPSGVGISNTKTKDGWVPLDGHTTTLPETQLRGSRTLNNAAMLDNTFFTTTNAWHIGEYDNAEIGRASCRERV